MPEREHLLTLTLEQEDEKVIATIRRGDETEPETMELPPHMAAQIPMALSMMQEQLS